MFSRITKAVLAARRMGQRVSGGEEKNAGRIRAEQIAAVARLSPFMMAAAAINAVMVLWVFRNSGHDNFLLAWSAIIPLAAWVGIRALRAKGALNKKRTASPHGIKRAVLNASVLGAFWGALPIALFPGAPSSEQVLLTCLAAGMLCGSGFALAAIPHAATAAALPIAAGSLFALYLDQHPLFWMAGFLIVVYACAVVLTAFTYHRLLVSQLLANVKVKKQGEIISLLLRDFEDNSSDWLWNTDSNGRLIEASKRMAEVFATPQVKLIGRDLVDILVVSGDQPQSSNNSIRMTLKAYFAEKKPFRGIVVETHINGQKRWLSLSGSPLSDESGKFIGFRGVGSDVTAEKHAEAELAHLARHDSLTGLTNRLYFRSMLHKSLQSIHTTGQDLAVLSLDLDQFKFINDTRGHPFGDALLRAVAKRLGECVGPNDLLTRLGGDEFAIVQTELPQPSSAIELSAHVIEQIQHPFTIEGTQVNIDVSVGICIAPRDGTDVDTLLKNVDLALYKSKNETTSQICIFEPEMGRRFLQTRELESALKEALANDEFYLEYQPQVCGGCHGIVGFEALVRWHHHERGIVEPGEFIPIAESMGIIPQLGEVVIRKACEAAALWPQNTTVAVNLSPLQFYNGDIVETVHACLSTSGLAPERLELEITEGVLFKHTDQVLDQLDALKQLGVTISMDDFGTGYSSLAYLWKFPFDKVKIDRSFVFALGKDRSVDEILRTIVALAQILQVKVVAEGVETERQTEYLTEIGCDQLQGYLFGRPMPQQQLAAEFLKRHRCDHPCCAEASEASLPRAAIDVQLRRTTAQ